MFINECNKTLIFALLAVLSGPSQAINPTREAIHATPIIKARHDGAIKEQPIYSSLHRGFILSDISDRPFNLGAPATLGLLWLGFAGLRLKRTKL